MQWQEEEESIWGERDLSCYPNDVVAERAGGELAGGGKSIPSSEGLIVCRLIPTAQSPLLVML